MIAIVPQETYPMRSAGFIVLAASVTGNVLSPCFSFHGSTFIITARLSLHATRVRSDLHVYDNKNSVCLEAPTWIRGTRLDKVNDNDRSLFSISGIFVRSA